MFELRIQKHSQHTDSKTADMEKSDIPITQIGDEVKVVGEDRL